MRLMTWIVGIEITRLGGESDFFHAAMVRDILKSILHAEFRRGSSAPTWRNVCPTIRTMNSCGKDL